MPINRDDIEQGDSPITPPDRDIDEQEVFGPEPVPIPEPEPEPEQSSKWSWVGSPDRPEAQESEDGISDLFEVGDDNDTDDLVRVDIEKDILDANPETGDLSDLVEVSEEDILGDEETGQVPLDYKPDAPRGRPLPRYRRTSLRYIPPPSMGRSG